MVKRKCMHRHVHAWSHSQTYIWHSWTQSQRDGHTVALEIHAYKINMHGHAWSLTVVPNFHVLYMYVYIDTYTVHVYMMYLKTHTHMDKHKHMHGYTNDVGLNACMDTHIQITHTHLHGRTHTHTHTCMDTHTHTETYRHMTCIDGMLYWLLDEETGNLGVCRQTMSSTDVMPANKDVSPNLQVTACSSFFLSWWSHAVTLTLWLWQCLSHLQVKQNHTCRHACECDKQNYC